MTSNPDRPYLRTPNRPEYAGDSKRLVSPPWVRHPLSPMLNTAATNAGRREADIVYRRGQGETVASIAADLGATSDAIMDVLDRANARDLERRRRHVINQTNYWNRKKTGWKLPPESS
jgi:hypothetical protein